MPTSTSSLLPLESHFARELPELCVPWQAAPATAPELVWLNDALALELGLDPERLRTPAGVAELIAAEVAEGATPVAMAYTGHQFGHLAPRLGDGRALLLGELVTDDGSQRDVHLKGSGRTPFARGGDGKAALGPMLREVLVSEALHALGIPTTRALAVVATGEQVVRDTLLPGAVLVRVAASHIRVGTFQYAAMAADDDLVRRLADHSIARHHAGVGDGDDRFLGLLEAVIEAQAALVARWLLVGFIHGVMNTDNTTISGETIDYGPCAFIDRFDPTTVFSSIDHAGRYAYGNQPAIAQWNLARLAETLLPLIDADTDTAIEAATAALNRFPDRYLAHWRDGMRAKLGLDGAEETDAALFDDWLALLHDQDVDLTSAFRALSDLVRGDPQPARRLFRTPEAFDAWADRHAARLPEDPATRDAVADAMDRVNPIHIPRNHLVEEALDAATNGDLAPFQALLEVITDPFEQGGRSPRYAEPAPADAGPYQTFCGT